MQLNTNLPKHNYTDIKIWPYLLRNKSHVGDQPFHFWSRKSKVGSRKSEVGSRNFFFFGSRKVFFFRKSEVPPRLCTQTELWICCGVRSRPKTEETGTESRTETKIGVYWCIPLPVLWSSSCVYACRAGSRYIHKMVYLTFRILGTASFFQLQTSQSTDKTDSFLFRSVFSHCHLNFWIQ